MDKAKIKFDDKEVEIAPGTKLVTVKNLPNVLFGCRGGVCGACLMQVVEGREHLESPSISESDFIEQLGMDCKDGYRLCCQTKVRSAGKVAIKTQE